MSSEPEDFNAFNHWDCLGASLMLGIVPAILNFVFNDKDIISTVFLAGAGIAVAVLVFLVAWITRWRIVGVIVNWVGTALTVLYISIAVYLWIPKDEESPAEVAEPVLQEASH